MPDTFPPRLEPGSTTLGPIIYLTGESVSALLMGWEQVEAAARDVEFALPHQIGQRVGALTNARMEFRNILHRLASAPPPMMVSPGPAA